MRPPVHVAAKRNACTLGIVDLAVVCRCDGADLPAAPVSLKCVGRCNPSIDDWQRSPQVETGSDLKTSGLPLNRCGHAMWSTLGKPDIPWT